MPNSKPGDSPITDMLFHGKHPFPPDIEDLLRQLHALDPQIIFDLALETYDWEAGGNPESERKWLRELLATHSASEGG